MRPRPAETDTTIALRKPCSLLFLVLLVMPLPATAGLIQGPVRGTVQLADGEQANDLVVHLHCVSHGLHGGHTADDVKRRVSSGEEFLIPWAYLGLSPIGCSLRVYHPRYVVTHVELRDDFFQQVGTIRLDTWEAFLDRGPTSPPAHPTYPWPSMELQQHLHDLLYNYIPTFDPGTERQSLRRYIPGLHALFTHVVATGAYGRSPRRNPLTPMGMIGRIEEAVSFAGSQRALFVAVSQNDTARVREVLKAGAYVDGWDQGGRTPLFLAAAAGATETVVALLDGGADLNIAPYGNWETPLSISLLRGHWTTAAALVVRGASVRAEGIHDAWLANALCGVGQRGDAQSLRVFLDAGLAPDLAQTNGVTPLMCAAQGKQLETARLLLRAGADVNARASHGRTPLRLARSARSPELITLLEEAGAKEE